jgi:tRNA-specific 2-thiouridylase
VPWYVVGKDASPGANVAYIAPGPEHRALFAREAAVGGCFWTSASGSPPGVFSSKHGKPAARLTAQTRYGGERVACEVRLVPSGDAPAIQPTKFGPKRSAVSDGAVLEVRFDAPTRALTPGQALVLYEGDACLGGGSVLYPGRSSHELAME